MVEVRHRLPAYVPARIALPEPGSPGRRGIGPEMSATYHTPVNAVTNGPKAHRLAIPESMTGAAQTLAVLRAHG